MQRIFEKKDNQPVSMIYDNPTSESFTKFRDMIRKSCEDQQKNSKNSKKGSYSSKYNHPHSMVKRPRSLIGASTMGSPVKLAPDEINKLNSYSDKISRNNATSKVDRALQRMKPIILGITGMSLNKIGLGISEKGGKDTVKKSVQKSRKGSGRSINLDQAENITRMVLSINIAKRKLIFEFDVDRNNDEDGMMEEESQNTGNQFDDGQKMRLEVTFSNVKEMDIFSEKNSLQFHTSSWELFEIFQESLTKPITWEESNMKRLLGRSLTVGEDTILNVEVTLAKDRYGKNLCTRISTLDRMLGAGLQFSVDGRQQRMISGGIRINAGQKFLPSRQEPSTKSQRYKNPADLKKLAINRQNKLGFDQTGLREILDPNEIKQLKGFEKEIKESKSFTIQINLTHDQ